MDGPLEAASTPAGNGWESRNWLSFPRGSPVLPCGSSRVFVQAFFSGVEDFRPGLHRVLPCHSRPRREHRDPSGRRQIMKRVALALAALSISTLGPPPPEAWGLGREPRGVREHDHHLRRQTRRRRDSRDAAEDRDQSYANAPTAAVGTASLQETGEGATREIAEVAIEGNRGTDSDYTLSTNTLGVRRRLRKRGPRRGGRAGLGAVRRRVVPRRRLRRKDRGGHVSNR